jgi:hypothetical protein
MSTNKAADALAAFPDSSLSQARKPQFGNVTYSKMIAASDMMKLSRNLPRTKQQQEM